MAPPSAYTDELASEICERIARGESLKSICRDKGMPPESTFRRWVLEDYGGLAALYARAREMQTECFVDEIVAIADSVADCTDSSIVHAARLAIDTRKWIASKMLPKRYGDRLDVESAGSLTIKIVHGLGDAPDE